MLFAHIFGCLYYLSARFDDNNPRSWVLSFNFLDTDPSEKYLYSMLWSVQTVYTLGYGNIPIRTTSEIILAIFWCIAGAGFYSFIVGNFSSLITNSTVV